MESSKAKLSLYSLARARPWIMVLLSGMLLGTSFLPWRLGFLSYVAFIPLFILIETIPRKTPEDLIFLPVKRFMIGLFRLLTFQFLWRRARNPLWYERKLISGNAQTFRYTYATFFIWGIIACHWLIFPVFTDGQPLEHIEFLVAGIMALVIMPAIFSIPFQFFSRIRHMFSPLLAAISLGFCWVTMEYWVLGWNLGWPWLTVGHSLSQFPGYIQYMEWTGILGVSIHIFTANVLLYALVQHLNFWQKISWKLLGAWSIWLFLPVLMYGFVELPEPSGKMRVRIVQPVFEEDNSLTRKDRVKKLMDLSMAYPVDSTDLIIWPEGAVPKAFTGSELLHDALMDPVITWVDSNWVPLVFGGVERKVYTNEEEITASAAHDPLDPGKWYDIFNVAWVMERDTLAGVHRKERFLPFIERVPFLPRLNFLEEWGFEPAKLYSSFARPDSAVSVPLAGGTRLGLMIREESVMGRMLADQSRAGADLLVMVTDDHPWGKSLGYQQHYLFSKMRAIESRRQIVRAASTGISAHIDEFGRTLKSLPWGKEGIIEAEASLHKNPTFYTRNPSLLGRVAQFLALGLILAALVVAWIRRKGRIVPREV